LVSSLYKTHRSLPPKSVQKVSSLYCFDALARNGAKSIIDKAAKLKTPESEKAAGYAGSFLLKVEGVLQGLTADMVGDGWTEGQVRFTIFFLRRIMRLQEANADLCSFADVHRKKCARSWTSGQRVKRFHQRRLRVYRISYKQPWLQVTLLHPARPRAGVMRSSR
jgi:hypothetical protein